MNLNERFERERAVSPVVGVALLIAMTVILAAVIGYVVLGMNATGAETPQATFSFEEDDSGNLDVTHEGGDELSEEHISVSVNGDAEMDRFSEDMTAGDTQTIYDDLDDGDEVRIVWNDPNSDQTNVIGEYHA